VADFGQGVLGDDMVAALQATDCPLRYMPDLLAVKGRRARLLDAKYGRLDTGNHAVEVASLESLCRWQYGAGVGVWLVFGNWTVANAHDVASDDQKTVGSFHGNGSGTDFYVFRSTSPYVLRFDAVFGMVAP